MARKPSRDLSTQRVIDLRRTLFYAFILWLGLCLRPSSTSADRPLVEDIAAGLAALAPPEWTGPRVDHPEEGLRPQSVGTYRSEYLPVSVHWSGVGEPPVQVLASALRAAEDALSFWLALGWPQVVPDGGLGGDGGLDLYLKSAPITALEVKTDGPIVWSFLDQATTFGVLSGAGHFENVSSSKSGSPCVSQAIFETLLFGLEPSESGGFRRATSRWLNRQLHGEHTCELDRNTQRADLKDRQLSMLGDEQLLQCVQGAIGNHQDAMLMLWQGARQRTWEGERLRAEPSIWSVLKVLLKAYNVGLEDLVSECAKNAAARVTVTQSEQGQGARSNVTQDPLQTAITWTPKKRRVRIDAQGAALQGYETRTHLLEIPTAHEGSELRIWFRGEYGVRWALQATQLADSGNILRSVQAPIRLKPQSYIPVRVERNARYMLIQVTNLPTKNPAPIYGGFLRSYHLILAKYP